MPKVDQFESKKIYCILSRGYKQNFAEITVNIAALDIGSVHIKRKLKKKIYKQRLPKRKGRYVTGSALRQNNWMVYWLYRSD